MRIIFHRQRRNGKVYVRWVKTELTEEERALIYEFGAPPIEWVEDCPHHLLNDPYCGNEKEFNSLPEAEEKEKEFVTSLQNLLRSLYQMKITVPPVVPYHVYDITREIIASEKDYSL